jgi:hypothetical protein
VAARLRRDMPKQSGNIERKGAKGIARCEKMAFPGQIRSLVTRTWSAHYLQHSLTPLQAARACSTCPTWNGSASVPLPPFMHYHTHTHTQTCITGCTRAALHVAPTHWTLDLHRTLVFLSALARWVHFSLGGSVESTVLEKRLASSKGQ